MSIQGPLAALGEAYVDVEVFSPDGKSRIPFRAKVDTGAYASVLEASFIAKLGLQAVEHVTLDTVGGPMPSHTYMARVVVAPIWDGLTLIVQANPGKDKMLLGRGWLKAFVFKYDGPGRRFTIGKGTDEPSDRTHPL